MAYISKGPRATGRAAGTAVLGMVLFTAACVAPPPPAPVAPTEPAPQQVVAPPATAPSGACNALGSSSTAAGTSAQTSAQTSVGTGEGGDSLSPSEAAGAARDAATESTADPSRPGETGSLPIVVTTIDDEGRPEVRQVLASDPSDASSSVRAVAVVTESQGGEVVAVEPERFLTTDSTDPADPTDPADSTIALPDPTEPAPFGAAGAPVTNDPLRDHQWALQQFEFESAWSRGNGAGVCVAVVDSGVQVNHPDLVGRVVASDDRTGEGVALAGHHGTHVAGIIAATADNARGIVGAAPGVELLNVKVLSSTTGSGLDSWVANGVIWAVTQGADVINLSLSGGAPSGAMEAAMDFAEVNGVVVVASGGNNGPTLNTWSWPAAFDWPIATASVSSDGSLSSFSTRADYVDVAAPGESIASTIAGSQYAYMSGTSMAAPYVSALVALIRSAHPDQTAQWVRDRAVATVADRGPAGWDEGFGHGIVDPWAATN